MTPQYFRKVQEASEHVADIVEAVVELEVDEEMQTNKNEKTGSLQLDISHDHSDTTLLVIGRGSRNGSKPLLVHFPEHVYHELMRSGNAGQAAVGVITWALAELKSRRETLKITFPYR